MDAAAAAPDGTAARDSTAVACLLFSPAAADQFAVATAASSCPTAVEALHDQVTDQGRYLNNIDVPASAWSDDAETAEVDGCAVDWQGVLDSTPATPPGPLPGHLTLTRQDDDGWLITVYRRC